MEVNIYVRERNGAREMTIPWLPEKINYESGEATMATYDIINKGPVAIHTGTGLKRVSWESILPGMNRNDTSLQRGGKKKPDAYHALLETWKMNGTPLNVLVVGFPINFDAIIENYNASPEGGFGDIPYELSFIEDRAITVTSMKEQSASAQSETKRTATQSATYTIKQGDTLWSIAKQFLGAGSKWNTIYTANKDIIESTAKKRRNGKGSDNGHWIYPGTVITIPGASSTSTSSTTKKTTTTTTTNTSSSGGSDSTSVSVTLSIQQLGDQANWGTCTVYVNGRMRTGGEAKTQTLTLKAGDVVRIATTGNCNISENNFTMTKNKTVTITWYQ